MHNNFNFYYRSWQKDKSGQEFYNEMFFPNLPAIGGREDKTDILKVKKTTNQKQKGEGE